MLAALHSGNDTTVVGEPLRFETEHPTSGDLMAPIITTALGVAQFFNPTKTPFADPLLSPWPDLSGVNGPPLV
jgi:hypothetical protein